MSGKEKYQFRKSKGLCTRCGKKEALNGITLCEKCNEYFKETKQYIRNLGICPMCQKNSIYLNEKYCDECLEAQRERCKRYHSKNRERLNANARMRSKNRVAERKSKGLCTKCGKRKATYNRSTCEICRIKSTEQSRVSRQEREAKKREVLC